MKYCPLSSHPVGDDGKCVSHACLGYAHPEKMQEHADWLAKEEGIYLEGWTTPPKQEPEPEKQKEPSKSRR